MKAASIGLVVVAAVDPDNLLQHVTIKQILWIKNNCVTAYDDSTTYCGVGTQKKNRDAHAKKRGLQFSLKLIDI